MQVLAGQMSLGIFLADINILKVVGGQWGDIYGVASLGPPGHSLQDLC